ncbi:hypothetical protein [Micromonospora sp. KC723]|uniref:hypothetical protein n=1 Tax=Micromonospora sp. KC723 TaxID=2530381 RepID=UPI001049734D|nr:hypothetical protein [Micromonospora sp. KC723]TDB77521.1 hypothetical protein E1165_03280 [Micromonospora sp. KC723]
MRMPATRDGLWGRRVLALLVAVAVAGPVVLGLSRLPSADELNLHIPVWLLLGAARAGAAVVAAPRRSPGVAGRDAVEPGLVARRSVAGWVEVVGNVVVVGVFAAGGLNALSGGPPSTRFVRPVLLVGGPHRRDGRVEGVWPRPTDWPPREPDPVVGGGDAAVSEERLIAAIEHFRSQPAAVGVGCR